MKLIWATRGRTWGFRFLLDGGEPDPLVTYSDAFSDAEDQREVFLRRAETVSLRFPDPLGRRDAAGRVIPHDFVLIWPRPWADGIDSVDDGRRLIWPLVGEEFARIWELDEPPRTDGGSGATNRIRDSR